MNYLNLNHIFDNLMSYLLYIDLIKSTIIDDNHLNIIYLVNIPFNI
jgi:hypothetical protein